MIKKIFFSFLMLGMSQALAFFGPIGPPIGSLQRTTMLNVQAAAVTNAILADKLIPQHRYSTAITPAGPMSFKCFKRPGRPAKMTVSLIALGGKKRFPVANCSPLVMNAVRSQAPVLLAEFKVKAKQKAIAAATVAAATAGAIQGEGPDGDDLAGN